MRRGLISWSREEVPVATLENRVARLQERMRAQGMDAVLVYTSLARPSAVSWLTQFVPYWNEGMLVVPARGGPVLLAAFSKRVQEWIREVSYLEDVVTAPKLGEGVVSLLQRRLPDFEQRRAAGAIRVGVVERDELPWTIGEALIEALGDKTLLDASGMFAAIRQPADAAELKLAQRALGIARRALESVPGSPARASQALAAVDASARAAGAEEVLFRVATDLGTKPVLSRIETDAELGSRWALQVSLAYKGIWVRTTRCYAADAAPASWGEADQWFARAASRLTYSTPDADAPNAPGKLAVWTLEACLGTQPFAVVAHGPARTQQAMPAPTRALPLESLAVLSVQLALPEGAWHATAPVVLGGDGKPSRLLAPE